MFRFTIRIYPYLHNKLMYFEILSILCLQKQPSLCDTESLPSLQSGTATLESNRAGSAKSPVSDIISPIQAMSPTGSDPRSAALSPTTSDPRSALSPTGSALSPTSSDPKSALSPVSDSKPPHRRSKRHKESRHYQESDILESPGVYYRSSVADKVSKSFLSSYKLKNYIYSDNNTCKFFSNRLVTMRTSGDLNP